MGGYNNSVGYYSTAYSAQINSNGTVGTWQTTTALPQGLHDATSVEYNGYVYVMGGVNGSNNTVSTVYYAPINANGTVGTWNTAPALPQGVNSATSVEYNGYVYEMGGVNNANSYLSTVYYAPLNPNGTVGTWSTSSNSLPLPTTAAASAQSNNYIYVMGGVAQSGGSITRTTSVYYASIALPPNTPASLGPTTSTNGTYSNNIAPTLSFSLSDSNPAATLSYEVQVANNSSFTSPLIDYTSALGPQGSTSFTVGQAAGSGTYTTGSAGQTLPDGSYYWRVQAIDSNGLTSGYTTANSGAIDFKVDTTPPTVPGTPSTSLSSTTNTTPSWSWTASTDSGSGLASTPYTVEWSTSSTFTSNVSSTTAKTNSIVLPVTLTPATWYVRVKAADAVGNVSAYSTAGLVTITSPPPPAPVTITSTTTTTTSSIVRPQQTNTTTASTSQITTTTQTSTSPSTTTSAQTQSTPIVLNSYSSYTSGSGKQENMSAGQVAYFKVGSQTHSATINKVGGDYVTLTLRSTPQTVTIQTGVTNEYNVTGSGKPNISITLLGTRNGVALLKFAAITTPVVHLATASSKKSSNNTTLITILIVFVIGLVTGVWLMWKRRLRSRAGQ